MKIIILALIGLTISANATKLSYENFKVYNVVPKTEDDVNYLTGLHDKEGYDFWTEHIKAGSNVRIMVYPQIEEEFVAYCKTNGMDIEISVPNLQKLIDATMQPAVSSRSTEKLGSLSWDRYYSLEEIHAWLDELEELYPNNVKTVNIGVSTEQRQIKGVIIDLKPDDRAEKPLTGMIEGGIHSREWISPATVTWIIKEFLTSTDPGVKQMAESFVWHIFPSINPDGYAYTFTTDRLWRKNRNTNHYQNCSMNDDLSRGVDLNRNFDYVWMSIGASNDSCTQTFAGASGSSEPETRAVSNYILTLKANTDMLYYIAFHSYSQMILIPYSHVSGIQKLQVSNYGDLYEIAIRGADKLTATHGTPYVVGVSAEILYPVSGSSFDFAKGVAEVPISYLFELRDLGQNGFLLPPEEIIPNNEEIMACLAEMDATTRKLGYYSSGSVSLVHSLVLTVGAFGVLFYLH
ncbi:zinc carboxypeptidase [Plutella xylostella]|uniref:zinc carboxypeptidase n=1 Tax=Plutella xylostella TaxID=51655 RepID=UPI002032DE6C|nr:zinc carboxypeptidase [Plutella xylostella]